MNRGVKVVLIGASLGLAYWVGVEVGKEKGKSETNETLETYKKNNQVLLNGYLNLFDQNKKLKTFYNVVEGMKIEEA